MLKLKPNRKLAMLFIALSIVWTAMLFAESSQQSAKIMSEVFGLDKVAHFVAFGVLGFLLCCSAVCLTGDRKLSTLATPVILVVTVGILEEGYQMTSPDRAASMLDLSADIAGVLFAAYLLRRLLVTGTTQSSEDNLLTVSNLTTASPTMDANHAGKQNDLAGKSISALKWNYIGRLVSLTLQFTIGIVLARMLGPEPFGLVAIAMFVQGLAGLFADAGLGAALIQSKQITDHDIRSVFSTQCCIGLLICLTISLASPLLAVFFKDPNASPVITLMATSFLIQSIGQTANALARRNLEFKRLQVISLAAYCIGYLGVGLPMAYLDYGVWSLVAAQLVQVSINAIVTLLSHKHPILPFVNPFRCRFLRFGVAITANNITSWGLGCIDTAIIGRFFETALLGSYNRAFNLVNMPMYSIVSSIQSVLISGYAKTQDNSASVKRTYIASVGVMALLFLPVYAAASAVADALVLGIYGQNWSMAVPLLKPLALAMPVHAMLAMTGPMLTGTGRPRYELNAQLATLCISLPLLIVAAQQSIDLMIYALLATFCLRFVALSIAARAALKFHFKQLIRVLLMPTVLAILMYAIAYELNEWQRSFGYDIQLRLLGNLLGCGLSYLALLILLRRLIFVGYVREFLTSIRAKLPRIFTKLLAI